MSKILYVFKHYVFLNISLSFFVSLDYLNVVDYFRTVAEVEKAEFYFAAAFDNKPLNEISGEDCLKHWTCKI